MATDANESKMATVAIESDRHSSQRYVAAAVLLVLALAISPMVIGLVSGRAELSFRINTISICADLFLVALIGALLSYGRLRRLFFILMGWTFPLFLVAMLEAGAAAVHLADRIAPLRDTSVLTKYDRFPGYFLSDIRSITYKQDGFSLYYPWKGDGIEINRLGLRTALPTPKANGEWRVAVTGGSTAWGSSVLDEDTIPVQLERALHTRGQGNTKVFNFGIGAATLAQELALLKHFRRIYEIDQAIFYTGGIDLTDTFIDALSKLGGEGRMSGLATWELVKTVRRLQVQFSSASPALLAKMDSDVLPRLQQINPLRIGILEADNYCKSVALRCDFVLAPVLMLRKSASGKELQLKQTLEKLYPRFDEAAARLYSDALRTGPQHRTYDMSAVFDRTEMRFFVDAVHINEAGNRMVAEGLAELATFGR